MLYWSTFASHPWRYRRKISVKFSRNITFRRWICTLFDMFQITYNCRVDSIKAHYWTKIRQQHNLYLSCKLKPVSVKCILSSYIHTYCSHILNDSIAIKWRFWVPSHSSHFYNARDRESLQAIRTRTLCLWKCKTVTQYIWYLNRRVLIHAKLCRMWKSLFLVSYGGGNLVNGRCSNTEAFIQDNIWYFIVANWKYSFFLKLWHSCCCGQTCSRLYRKFLI